MKTAAILKLRQQLIKMQDVAGDETTLGQALVLLEVALHPGEKVTHLAPKLAGEPTYSSVSRAVDILGDRRARGVYLTKKGERLLQELA